MIKDAYDYYPLTELIFAFHSEGVKGKILKIIIFTLKEDGQWNLAFGDWKNNAINDSIMTNNQDVVKVIGTVAKATYAFFENHPAATLEINQLMRSEKFYIILFFNDIFVILKVSFKSWLMLKVKKRFIHLKNCATVLNYH
jgi:hypothetical protein